MSTIRKYARQVRWRWFLPPLMASTSFALACMAMVQYLSWNNPMRGMDAPGNMEPLPRLLMWVLNGPAMLSLFQVERLSYPFGKSYIDLRFFPAVVVFWLLLGIGLDWKLTHPDRLLIRPKGIRIALFGLLLALCLLVACVIFVQLRSHLLWQFIIEEFRVFGWWTDDLSLFPLLAWIFFGVAYFSTKLWNTLKRRPRLASGPTT